MTEDDDRAERLRRRRQQSKDKAQPSERDETDKQSNTSQADKQSKPSKQSVEDETDESSVKDEQVGTYMYLPKWQKKDLQRLYNVKKAEYEYEHDTEFEKNRHFYPLVVKYGTASLDDAEPDQIHDWIEKMAE